MNLHFFLHKQCGRNTLCYTLYNIHYFSSLHISDASNDIKKCSARQRKRVEVRGCVYLKNPKIANSIASYIAKEGNSGYLLEANPGPGILSSALLKNGIKHLRVFEKNQEYLPTLEAISAANPSMEVVKQDLMMIPPLEYKKTYDFESSSFLKQYFDNTFQNIPVTSWVKDPSFQIFSVIANKRGHKFLRYLLPALVNLETLFSFGRCDFFLLVSETEYMSMSALPNENFSQYRWSTVLYNILYEIKCLDKFSADSENFYFTSTQGRKSPYFYLLKLTPNPDIFSPPMTPEKLQEFFYFVRSNLAKRTDLVIKSIEKWMPFCGPRLIKEGLNVFVRFGDLSPVEILRLFHIVSSWSEYRGCYSEALTCQFNRKKFVEEDIE